MPRDLLSRIESLDAERDHLEIYRISATQEFPWDTVRALELALYRTFCIPSIARVLDRTGEFAVRAQKRYDDTVLLMGEILADGYDGPRGKAALRRINGMHHRTHGISQHDLRYVLATFTVVPVRWIDAFGWRPLCWHERHAAYAYYREVGLRMGITDLPGSYPETADLLDDYEERYMRFTPANQRTAEATRELFVGWLSPLPAPLVRAGVHALLDDQMLAAFGFRSPPRLLPPLARAGLRARARIVRRLPQRDVPLQPQDNPFLRTYPDGYVVSELGADLPC